MLTFTFYQEAKVVIKSLTAIYNEKRTNQIDNDVPNFF